nr:putative oxidoreductase [Mycobacterium pseudoshottsii]
MGVRGYRDEFLQEPDIILWDNRVLMHRAKHGTASGTLTTYRLTMLDGLETPGYPA